MKEYKEQPIISERAKRASSVMFVFNRDFRYVYIYILSASERSERAQSLFMSIEISDIYIYIYMWPYVNLYAHAREIIAKKRP